MRRKLGIVLMVVVTLTVMVGSALAIKMLPKDGFYQVKEIPKEPIATPDPRAVAVGSEGGYSSYVENTDLKDSGFVELHWNAKAYSLYGCSVASINYVNPSRSNIGMTLSVAIFDGNLIKYFGTTFRSDDETLELAMLGHDALQNGILFSNAAFLVEEGGLFEGMTAEEVSKLTKEELVAHLVEKGFLGMSGEQLNLLDEAGVRALSEIDRLTLAQLGGYNFYSYYQRIGDTGVINPGYGIYEVELYTLPGMITIPKGEYEGIYVLNAYDKNWNRMSDFFIHLPITLTIKEDLPEELQEEYGITLATRID